MFYSSCQKLSKEYLTIYKRTKCQYESETSFLTRFNFRILRPKAKKSIYHWKIPLTFEHIELRTKKKWCVHVMRARKCAFRFGSSLFDMKFTINLLVLTALPPGILACIFCHVWLFWTHSWLNTLFFINQQNFVLFSKLIKVLYTK